MIVPWLRKPPANWQRLPGKQIYLRSGSPPEAQVVIDGSPKAKLRPVIEPAFASNNVLPAVPPQVAFFNTATGNTTQEGLALDLSLCNMLQGNSFGEPEVFDVVGVQLLFEYGMPVQEINRLVDAGAFTFQFGTRNEIELPLDELQGGAGLVGVGDLFEERSVQMGVPAASNFYDMSLNGFPRRIWSQESFRVFLSFRQIGLVLPVARRIKIKLKGVHYKR